MNARTQITMDAETQRRAQAKAAELGLSFAEYVRRLVAADLGDTRKAAFDITQLFDLVTDGPETDIARDKDKMIGEAVWRAHLSETGQSDARKPK